MSILDWVELLLDLSETQKKELEMFCQPKFLKAWETLFKEQEEATAMYFLIDWTIEISRVMQWKKVLLWEVHSEEILWEMALFWDSWKRMATAKALSDCKLIVVLSFSIKQMLNENLELLEKIKDIINYRMIKNKNVIK